MRSFWFGVLVCAAMLVACSDGDSDFATRPSDGSSSSAKSSSSSAKSSSSEYERVQCDVKTDGNCIKDDRDGQTYKTVKIGDQVWMAENLNYEVDSSFCYKDSAEYCEKYGRFYIWAAAVGKSESECGYGNTCSLPSGNIQGVCPEGWHLPSNTEWETLFDAAGGRSMAGTVLKSTFGWKNRGNGSEAFSFSALPVGIRGYSGSYYGEGDNAYFWSSTEYDSNEAYSVYLNYGRDYATLSYISKDHGFSVRCIKDDASGQTAQSSSSSAKSSSSVTPLSSDSETSVSSSSSVTLATPCKTKSEDNCEYVKLVDVRDGQAYKTVKIGDQWWMAENLNFRTDSSFCFDHEERNCTMYGRLYTWAAASSACPSGWHLPSVTEFENLFTAVGGSSTGGLKLKATSSWYDGGNGTDDFGFSAISTGIMDYDMNYHFREGNNAFFWSSSENDPNNALFMGLLYDKDIADLSSHFKSFGVAVRCVKD